MLALIAIVSFGLARLFQAQQGGMLCSFCLTIVTNTQEEFGPSIVNASDVQLLLYFRRKCPRYFIESAMMAVECEYLVSHHPLILCRDLRSGKSALETCIDLYACFN